LSWQVYLGDLLYSMIRAGTPLLLGTLGEIYAERAGVLNLGVEGMVIVGAVTGYVVTLSTGNPWLGVLAAAISGGALSLIHAFLSITLRANQVVSGLALTMLGLGLSSIIGRIFIGIPLPSSITPIEIPILSKVPIIGQALFSHDPLVYFSMLLAPIMWFVLYKTRIGIKIRAVGENPAAADAAGINVYMIRYICVFIGGLLSGLAGAYLSESYTPAWIENLTAGTGWIIVGLTIFALWNPIRAMLGSYLFGGVRVLQFRLQPLGISPNLLAMLPYISTIVVLLIGVKETLRKRIGAPSALGVPYVREERE